LRFEGLDGALCGIATVDIWRDKLVTCFPRVLNGGLESDTVFFVKDL
jgi:hypothetical protein